jgi:NAD(P)H-dependent flavin oxidoreductase YrpB (nitropropane dioxygenase family)
MRLNDAGEPIYGERDIVELSAMRDIGLPFWLAGGTGSPEALEHALSQGAAGIQVGTLFAYSDESGFTKDIKQRIIAGALRHTLQVRTDARSSPTGYPFKVVIDNAEEPAFAPRERTCDLGYLREAVRRDDGTLDYRCAAEPIDQFVKKGGAIEDTVDRRCLCNTLCAAVGLPQFREGGFQEPAIITSGDDVVNMATFLDGRTHYSAADVIAYLTREATAVV